MQCNKVSIAIWVNFFREIATMPEIRTDQRFHAKKCFYIIFSWNCTVHFFLFTLQTFTQNHSFFDGHFLGFEKVREMGPFPKIHFRREKNESLFFFLCPAATLWDFQKTFFSISCKNALLRKLLSIAWRLKSSQLSFSSFCRLNLWTTMKTTRNFV